MARLISDIPGRMRLKLERGERPAASQVQPRLLSLPGVEDARFTARASSLTISYNPAMISHDAVLGILASAGLTAVTEQQAHLPYAGISPTAQVVMANLAAGNTAVVRFSKGTADLKLLAPLLLALLGATQGLLRGFQFSRIPGYLFLWYAFDLFYKLHVTLSRPAIEPRRPNPGSRPFQAP
ncbi:MAG: hypothetical protein GEU75_10705 [Dehalococcoidia bacterium]|nr:hypothetical protein [Dehalococcoidia bacterium]